MRIFWNVGDCTGVRHGELSLKSKTTNAIRNEIVSTFLFFTCTDHVSAYSSASTPFGRHAPCWVAAFLPNGVHVSFPPRVHCLSRCVYSADLKPHHLRCVQVHRARSRQVAGREQDCGKFNNVYLLLSELNSPASEPSCSALGSARDFHCMRHRFSSFYVAPALKRFAATFLSS